MKQTFFRFEKKYKKCRNVYTFAFLNFIIQVNLFLL